MIIILKPKKQNVKWKNVDFFNIETKKKVYMHKKFYSQIKLTQTQLHLS